VTRSPRYIGRYIPSSGARRQRQVVGITGSSGLFTGGRTVTSDRDGLVGTTIHAGTQEARDGRQGSLC